jgi:hypothetical protein
MTPGPLPHCRWMLLSLVVSAVLGGCTSGEAGPGGTSADPEQLTSLGAFENALAIDPVRAGPLAREKIAAARKQRGL